jgi:hypothetical protein
MPIFVFCNWRNLLKCPKSRKNSYYKENLLVHNERKLTWHGNVLSSWAVKTWHVEPLSFNGLTATALGLYFCVLKTTFFYHKVCVCVCVCVCAEYNEQAITYVHFLKKSSPATRHAGAWRERRYSSYSFLTSALDGVSGQRHAPAALFPGERTPRYPLYRRLGGPQSRSGHRGKRKNPFPLPRIEPR